MATATVSIASTVTPGVTLSNPVSLEELQALGTPTVTVDSTAGISNVVGTNEGFTIIVEADDTTDPENNGAKVVAAVAAAGALGPTAEFPATVLLMPGDYYLNALPITMDTNYVHLAGATGNPYDTIIRSDGSDWIDASASGIHVSNIFFEDGEFDDDTAGAKTDLLIRNCVLQSTIGTYPFPISHTLYFKMQDCKIVAAGRSSNHTTFAGDLVNCEFTGSNTIYLADGVQVRHCTVEPTLNAAAAVNAKIYHCALKAALGGNITNDIGTPYNVVNSGVAV